MYRMERLEFIKNFQQGSRQRPDNPLRLYEQMGRISLFWTDVDGQIIYTQFNIADFRDAIEEQNFRMNLLERAQLLNSLPSFVTSTAPAEDVFAGDDVDELTTEEMIS